MFLIDVTYLVPMETVNAVLPEHIAFLEEQMAAGIFLTSGPKVPRTGGVILARGLSREELLALLRRDPFQARGVGEYRVTEIAAGRCAPGFENLLDR